MVPLSNRVKLHSSPEEKIMVERHRTWFYRLAGQVFAQSVTFKIPLTAPKAREVLRKTVGVPAELWGRAI